MWYNSEAADPPLGVPRRGRPQQKAENARKGVERVKKRIVIAALCVLLLAALIPGEAVKADDGLSFLAINDYLPPELINVVVSYGGLTYVPSYIFNSYNLGIYYTYYATNSTAYVYNASNQIFFELSTGRTYDGSENEYDAPAILWGGVVYLPLNFLINYFGTFTSRVIGSNAYGSILRLSSGSVALTDDEFFRAAEASMRRIYLKRQTEATPAPASSPKPPEKPTPTPTEKPTREGDAVSLGLAGMPTAAALELMRRQSVRACIFLSAEEIRSDPDMVRCLACEGYPLGVRSPDGTAEACEEAAALLWEAARVRTILAVTAEDAAAPEGMVVFRAAQEAETPDQDAAFAVTSRLESSKGDQLLILPDGGGDAAALQIVLYFLADLEFTVTAIRETDGGKTPITP